MEAVILDGSRDGDEGLAPILSHLSSELDRRGWSYHEYALRSMDLRFCRGCFGCWVQTPGLCLSNDDTNDLNATIIRSDLLVLSTRVTFGGYSSVLKRAVDGLIGLGSPLFMKIDGEIHHKKRYPRYPKILALGLLSDLDVESERTFRTLVARNALNAHVQGPAVGVFQESWSPSQTLETVNKLLADLGVAP
jgi:hypothetical protein